MCEVIGEVLFGQIVTPYVLFYTYSMVLRSVECWVAPTYKRHHAHNSQGEGGDEVDLARSGGLYMSFVRPCTALAEDVEFGGPVVRPILEPLPKWDLVLEIMQVSPYHIILASTLYSLPPLPPSPLPCLLIMPTRQICAGGGPRFCA